MSFLRFCHQTVIIRLYDEGMSNELPSPSSSQTDQTSAPSPRRLHLPDPYQPSWGMRALPYVVASLFGVITSFMTIRKEFYDKMKQTGDYAKKLHEDRNKARDAYHEMLIKANETDPVTGQYLHPEKVITRAESIKMKDQIERAYTEPFWKSVNDALHLPKKMWTPRSLIVGTWRRLDELGPHKRNEIFFKVATTVGISLGSFLLISRNLRLGRELHDIHAAVNEQNPDLDDLREQIKSMAAGGEIAATDHPANDNNPGIPQTQVQTSELQHDEKKIAAHAQHANGLNS